MNMNMSILHSIILFSSLLFFPAHLLAQSAVPLTPATETPFTPESNNDRARIQSISTPPVDLSGAKLGFDVTIQNPNNRAIRCINTKFLAFMGIFGERCQRSDYSRYVDANAGKGPIDIEANQEFNATLVGNTVREERGRILSPMKDLEFCRRDAWELNCGFNCGNGKKFNDFWDVPITGGTRKFKCDATGEVKRTSDPVDCINGFSKDIVNDRCLKMCDAEHSAGDEWTTNIAFGRIISRCLSDGSVLRQTICDAPAYLDAGLCKQPAPPPPPPPPIPPPSGSRECSTDGAFKCGSDGLRYRCSNGKWVRTGNLCGGSGGGSGGGAGGGIRHPVML